MGGDDDECFDLYWTDRSRKFLTNATVRQCPLDYPVRCSEARRYSAVSTSSDPASGIPRLVIPRAQRTAFAPFDAMDGLAPFPISDGFDAGNVDEFAKLFDYMPEVPRQTPSRPTSRGGSLKRGSDSETDSDRRDAEVSKRVRPSEQDGGGAAVGDSVPESSDQSDLQAITDLLSLRRISSPAPPVAVEPITLRPPEDDDFELVDFDEEPISVPLGRSQPPLIQFDDFVFGHDEAESTPASSGGHVLGRATEGRQLSSLARWRLANQGAFRRPPTPGTVNIDPQYFNPIRASPPSQGWSDEDIENVFRGIGSGSRRLVVPTAAPRGLPGSRGVANLGLTCYFGATLQVLSHSNRLRQYLESHPSVNPNALETHLREFIARMWAPENTESAIRPADAFRAFSTLNPAEFRVDHMSDAHEALMAILDSVAESMKPAGSALHERSSLDPLLAIETTQRVSCRGCRALSERRELGFEVLVNIPELAVSAVPRQVETASTGAGFLDMDEALELLGMGPVTTEDKKHEEPVLESQAADFVTLNDCFATFAGEDMVAEYDCERCNPVRHDAGQVRRITSTSGIMTIALRRFTYEDMKISTPVEIPVRLNMSEIAGSETQGLYTLVGVVNHYGTTRHGGHYTAMVYNSAQGRWMKMDDSHSEPDMQFGTTGSFRSTEAYILIYERIDPEVQGDLAETVAAGDDVSDVAIPSSSTKPPTETTSSI